MRAAQRAFDQTGGLHAAALFSPRGELIEIREDVGRHNALDKLVGSQVLAGALPLHDRILMVSGRVSFEIVQKAAVAGVPIVVRRCRRRRTSRSRPADGVLSVPRGTLVGSPRRGSTWRAGVNVVTGPTGTAPAIDLQRT